MRVSVKPCMEVLAQGVEDDVEKPTIRRQKCDDVKTCSA